VGSDKRTSGWRSWVVDRWLPVRSQQALVIRLETIEQRLDALDQTLGALRASTDAAARAAEELPTLREALAALEKQIGRAGREQFKANTLAEAQAARLDTALDTLRAADTRREADLAALREQSRSAQASARLEHVRAVLPTLDGLDEALRSGRRLLATTDDRRPTESDRAQDLVDSQRSFVDWLLGRTRVPQQADDSAPRQPEESRKALDAWLVGLTFVRQRLLDTLAAEGVRPMDAEGQPFDPQRHIALEVVPASNGLPPGAVAAELRRGYMVGERVLRHAEVAVAQDDRPPTTDHRPPTDE
jgi:molecular chaperone GrpE